MYNGISRSFVEGYLLGLAGLPVKTALGAALPPAADREKPAMFFYNGIGPLPALPEGYDQCPCATVTDMGDGAYRLHLSDVPFFARLNDSGTFNLANYYNDTGILFYMFTHNAAAGRWSVYNPDILGTNRFIAGGREKGWANYDMLTKEGDVYIHKSAPIPVIGGKENPIAPSVFLAGLRFGILSRHGKALPELPDGVLISSDGYILTDRNGVYLIAAVAAEPDEPAVPDEPGEVSTMYLYGTPSESGNIGLRVGDSVTYYSGAVAPNIPAIDELPNFAVVKMSDGTIRAAYSSAYAQYNVSTGNLILGGIMGKYAFSDLVDGAWVNTVPKTTTMNGYSVSKPDILWANHAIKQWEVAEYPAPIPVGKIVDYNGDVPIYEQKEDS